ncbi:GNAT family N-acetyltransferase [Aureitalea marina]|uniref:GNAT family N-acetyltransferase n=1 Tax=Aureitalea marina TaxID=930804 RepID=A0A2S7KRN5_9FLAO|nr:GNAT family N-acetyltransferase [Aureitalea marina]PQB05292.1 GNAT family N-acetyltransferase [Aureitalea marina]
MPDIIVETDRLILREFRPQDAEKMYLLNLDPEVIRYTGDPPFQSVQDASNFLTGYDDYKSNGYGRWAVLRKVDGEFIGWCGLKKHQDGMVDIGFRFYRKDWGKGYATESAQATLNFGLEELALEEIVGRAARENLASIRVLEKLGMAYWKDAPCDGIADAVYYRIRR